MQFEPWLARAARVRPQVPALQTATERLTYEELVDSVASAERELEGLGAGPGANVGLALPAGVDFAVALHAAWCLGACAVPLDLRLSDGERAQIAAGCDVVVGAPLARDRIGRGRRDREGATCPVDDRALVIHTSGSTGAPKPVTLTFENLLWSALGSAVALGLHPHERWLCTLPLSHVGGLSIVVRSAIYGTTAVVHERFDTDAVLAALAAPVAGPTLVSLVPTTLARLLDAGLRNPPALRCALIGGAPLTPALGPRARGAQVPVSQTYGLTEACSQVTTQPPGDPANTSSDAGPPLFCTRVRLGYDAEIEVRGPTVATAALAADGWLHTGDIGTIDPATGRLTVTGRLADTIITGGENVAPAEVEAVLEQHSGVAEAVVHGVPDDRWGEAVVATVVAAPGAAGSPPDPAELIAHCAQRLAPYKVPKRIGFARELPRTPSGKLRRGAL